MAEIMIKAAGFVFVIIIAFILKQVHVLEKRDGLTIATIIMNVTLPCALLTNASGITIDQSMIILLLIGLASNIIMLFISFMLSRKEENILKGYYMINCSGYNIGNFVMPFVQSFFPGMGVAYLCMFDVGNSIMCLGGSYALAGSVASSNQKLTPKTVIKKLFSSIPFDVYLLIFVLALFKISIPQPILSMASFAISKATFMITKPITQPIIGSKIFSPNIAPATPIKLPTDESASDLWCHASALNASELILLALIFVYQNIPSFAIIDTMAANNAIFPGVLIGALVYILSIPS